MALSDRPYMTEGEPFPGLGSLRAPPRISATGALVAANVAVFVVGWIAGWPEGMHDFFACSANGVLREGRVWTLLTAEFAHAGLLHLVVNVWLLWMFGRELETIYGAREIAAIYALGAIVASAGHVLATSLQHTPQVATVGASGAVMGLLVLYAAHFPHRRIYLWGLVPVAMWALAVGYVVLDLAGALQPSSAGPIAHAAHLGGAALGFLWWRLDLRIFRGRAPRAKRAGRGRSRAPRPWRPREPASAHPPVDRRRLDELLEKVGKQGISSLSESERSDLLRASRELRGE